MRKPKRGPEFADIIRNLPPGFSDKYAEPSVREWVNKANNAMWNWEECSHRAKLAGLSIELFWAMVKLSRIPSTDDRIPLKDTHDRTFGFRMPASLQQLLHYIDTHLGGAVQVAWPT